MSASRWIALHCGDESHALLEKHPNAFLLLTQIAMRAKWKDCPITGLEAGQAFIGDWREAGIRSEMAYRHAKSVLARCKLATFKGTNKGTVATLANPTIFSITAPTNNGQSSNRTTGQQQTGSELGTTNHTDIRIYGDSETIHEMDSNSAPVGTALVALDSTLINWETARKIAKDLHEKEGRHPNSQFGIFPPEEIEEWAKNWHTDYLATGGFLKGSKIKNPKAALEAWLRSCASSQSKRFKELREASSSDEEEPPF